LKNKRATDLSSVALKSTLFQPTLLILLKQPHLIKAMLIDFKWQGEVPGTLKQQIGRRLFAVAQAFEAQSID
jgi:hypothetical protein